MSIIKPITNQKNNIFIIKKQNEKLKKKYR